MIAKATRLNKPTKTKRRTLISFFVGILVAAGARRAVDGFTIGVE
jgi:hypothetical protein